MKHYFIYITTANTDEAGAIGRALVEERLAACANIIDPMSSIYWWDGKVQEDRETVLIAKTTERHVNDLISRAVELHSYDNPAVTALPITEGSPKYLKWITDSTGG